MYYYIYKVINLVNNKIYIGVHKTTDLNDGYLGSGKLIRSAIEKHGIHNFKKEIMEFFDSYQEALAREKEIVDDEFLLREDTYNIRRGGSGGFDYINKNGLGYLTQNRPYGELNHFYGRTHTEETKTKIAEHTRRNKQGVTLTGEHKKNISKSLTGIPHTEERRKNISKACKGRQAHNKGHPAPRWCCPVCGREGGGIGNGKKHFKNCGVDYESEDRKL